MEEHAEGALSENTLSSEEFDPNQLEEDNGDVSSSKGGGPEKKYNICDFSSLSGQDACLAKTEE
ncbi:18040_t:CDS:2 [Rhizophagus irregularis]|nr:18040_t:CDS:2 [Rhizophagus irregularis]